MIEYDRNLKVYMIYTYSLEEQMDDMCLTTLAKYLSWTLFILNNTNVERTITNIYIWQVTVEYKRYACQIKNCNGIFKVRIFGLSAACINNHSLIETWNLLVQIETFNIKWWITINLGHVCMVRCHSRTKGAGKLKGSTEKASLKV